MQGIPFAAEVFVASAGILDWLVFNGAITLSALRYLGI
jgi:hypothetical protein